MALDRIQLTDFRNHRATSLIGSGRFNLLVGENGAGKTNVLEALSLFSPGRGLRRAALADMAGPHGDGGFAASAELNGEVRLGTGVRAERPGRRAVLVNGSDTPAASLGEWLSIGWLTPAQDRLFMDGEGGRRRFVDRLALALEPAHASHAARYESALRERNRLLADPAEPDPAWLDAIEAQLAESGALVAQARARLIDRLGLALAGLPDSPFARPEIAYLPGGPLERDELAQAFAAGRRRDRGARRTLSGPHRDEIAVHMAAKGMPAAECSTGEQKAMVIALTLAHAGLLDDQRSRVLLLDEVAAHLDPLRRAALFERLRVGTAQVWLTGTEPAPFSEILGEAATWRISGGTVERL